MSRRQLIIAPRGPPGALGDRQARRCHANCFDSASFRRLASLKGPKPFSAGPRKKRDVQRCMMPVPPERAGDVGQAVLSPLFAPLEGSGRGAGHCGQKEATCPDLVKRSVEGGGGTRKQAFGKCGRHVITENNGAFVRGRRGRPETLDRSNMTGRLLRARCISRRARALDATRW